MSKRPRKKTQADFEAIVENQIALGKRFLWLLIVPFVISAVLLFMVVTMSSRLTDVEVVTKQLTIERLLAQDHNLALAVNQYEQIARTRETAPILARLGILYFMLDSKKNDQIAIKTLERAKDVDPEYWETYRYLNFIYASNDQAEKAIAVGEKGLKLNEYDSMVFNNLAWVYATFKEPFQNLPRARQYAERALELTNGRNREVLDTLAEIYFREGGPEKQKLAREFLRKAIAIAPNGNTSHLDHFKKLFPDEKP